MSSLFFNVKWFMIERPYTSEDSHLEIMGSSPGTARKIRRIYICSVFYCCLGVRVSFLLRSCRGREKHDGKIEPSPPI